CYCHALGQFKGTLLGIFLFDYLDRLKRFIAGYIPLSRTDASLNRQSACSPSVCLLLLLPPPESLVLPSRHYQTNFARRRFAASLLPPSSDGTSATVWHHLRILVLAIVRVSLPCLRLHSTAVDICPNLVTPVPWVPSSYAGSSLVNIGLVVRHLPGPIIKFAFSPSPLP
ncbi:hypothetical protein BO99DRAFT_376512, partial [Aspergillus violaceofuscus CBS 115571]